MNKASNHSALVGEVPDISSGMILLLAIASGLIVANLYYAQTLVGPISASTGLSAKAAGLIVTLTQIGYTLGLLFVVPLADLLENRRLIITGLLVTAAALIAAAISTGPLVFLAAALAIGLGSVAAQVIVPFAAHLSKEATRGQAVGKVVSGLLLGIMLARPAASLVADHASWHVVFGGAAVLMLGLAMVLRRALPVRRPVSKIRYAALMASLWHLLAGTAVLRRRAAYHAGLFGAFSLFWTVTPLVLASPAFGLSQTGIAIFALVGMAGAVASPIAGRLADAGHTLPATAAALMLGMVAFALPMFAPQSPHLALGLLVVASIVLDMGVAANLVLGQRAIFSLAPEVRGRLNGLYFALFFAGGAAGSAIGGWIYASYGWQATLLTGMAFPSLALLVWLGEFMTSLSRRTA
ncbi:MFS transporter [Janthinobacterium psychrotolerans]|uniref:Putative arabinose efflux permease, MFS family n=1 Tax=Janthinobacterium psychrotolerans TaxID=1747903 RepID=A0A1A7BZX7_9BURK|nr:MFS transporter [Janthinobacterium psychrotolerans]OBV38304.1 putative arabinose efflux permease, MFS family [Janthinobacterium psychrotolerans]